MQTIAALHGRGGDNSDKVWLQWAHRSSRHLRGKRSHNMSTYVIQNTSYIYDHVVTLNEMQ